MKRMRGNIRAATWGSWALEEDLFGGDHGEAQAVVVPLDGVAELGLRAALDGAPGEAGVREAAGAGGGGNLVLVAVVVEAVLDHRPEAARVGPEDDPRWEEGAEVVAAVVLELAPPELVRLLRRHRRLHGSLSHSARAGALGVRRTGGEEMVTGGEW